MGKIIFKSWEEQLEQFQQRGMEVDMTKDYKKLQHINYYKLKEIASPLSRRHNGTIEYDGVSFDEVLTRYYQNKNLRIYLFHAIDKIEISVKTQLAYLLGKKYGPFGYLNFSNWCNKQKYSRYFIECEQLYIKKNILRALKKSSIPELKNKSYVDQDGFPVVWLAIDLLTFGDVVQILELMSIKNLKRISDVYNCNKSEFISWMKCLNFVRNLCAHNGNIVNLSVTTKPKIRKKWNDILYQNNNKPTNKLAVVILIVYTLVYPINENYRFGNILSTLKSLCGKNGKYASLIGFKSKKSIKKIKQICIKEETEV